MKKVWQNLIFVIFVSFLCGQIAFAQTTTTPETKPQTTPSVEKPAENKGETETKSEEKSSMTETVPTTKTDEIVAGQDDKGKKNASDDKGKTNPQPQVSEEETAIVPYYETALKEYYLGPRDIISVEVFGQCPNYCKLNITVPPTGRISYPLIKEGVVVKGKTVEQVRDEITKKLDEYIIDPQVTVSLDKAMSARYSIIGDVASPGVRVMEQRLNIVEALAEAGGIIKTGDMKKVTVLRLGVDGNLKPMIVNIKDVMAGKSAPIYLLPGDQIIVPGKRIGIMETVLKYSSILTFGRTFATGGAF